jgi:hypothetical protein
MNFCCLSNARCCVETLLFALLDERLVSTRVWKSGISFEVKNVIDDACEKRTVVTDQQDRFVG